ncbi:MAG: thiamine-phosphate kinase [Pirellulales bacterium]
MEAELIRWLRSRIPAHPQLSLGIGSDAAVVSLPSQRAVVTTDALMDGTDFLLSEVDPVRVGHKALAVNLSDLAAMGAKPVAALVALTLPRANALPLAQRLYEGILPLAERFKVAIAGGDTNTWDGPLVISITAIGEPVAERVWTRAGARPGDHIVVTGEFGGSILSKHLDFIPRVDTALHIAAHYRVHAATDVSDGLSLDLNHILEESNCGALLNLERIPIAMAAREMADREKNSRTPLDRALGDGEDFELVMILSAPEADRLCEDPVLRGDGEAAASVRIIGRITERRGLWGRVEEGTPEPLVPRGYEH